MKRECHACKIETRWTPYGLEWNGKKLYFCERSCFNHYVTALIETVSPVMFTQGEPTETAEFIWQVEGQDNAANA